MSLPNPSSLAADSPVRASFHAALEQIESYPVERNWRPAFLTPLSTLPQPRRMALADLPGRRPLVAPFGGQALTLAGACQALRQGSLTAAALLDQVLAAIDRRQPTLNAFVYVTPPAELQLLTEELDRELRAGVCRGTLHGIPIAVKDLFDVAGMPNTASSPVLDDNVSHADAGSVRLLKAAGAVIMGKTHTHEFSLGATTPQSRNPWDPTRDPGGSSGGSAIAVATGMSLGALATDTRASLRVPAALCGVVGYKPTFGLAPSDGIIMSSWSLDHVGHMAPTVEDAALLIGCARPDPAYPRRRGAAQEHAGRAHWRAGCGPPGRGSGHHRRLPAGRGRHARAGAEVIEIETPAAADFDLAVGMGLIVSRAEAAAYHTIYGDRRQRYATTAVAEQMDEAGRVSAVHYLQAQRAREDLRWRMLRGFDSYDALLMPTTRMAAPKSDESDYYFLALARNCILWSVLGFPAISLPCGRTPLDLPVGAQLVAAPYDDARLLAIAAALELELSRG